MDSAIKAAVVALFLADRCNVDDLPEGDPGRKSVKAMEDHVTSSVDYFRSKFPSWCPDPKSISTSSVFD